MFIYLSLSQYLSFYMFNDIKLADRVIFNSYNGSHWKDFNYLNNNIPTAEQLMQCITFTSKKNKKEKRDKYNRTIFDTTVVNFK